LRWVEAGRLHRLSRGIYALGHRALSFEGELAADLLRVGSGAALSHSTAAWWWELLRFAPPQTHISHTGRAGSTTAVIVHHPSAVARCRHRGLPVTGVLQRSST
jgi:hypothetical protein